MNKIEYYEFCTIIKRLEVEYSDLDETRKKLHYDKLCHFPSWVLKEMVNQILETHERTYYPKLSLLIKSAESIQYYKQSNKRKPVYCEKCNSTGWRWLDWVDKDGKKREQAFRCDCENGDRLSHRIYTYSEAKVKLGIPNEKPLNLELVDYTMVKADPSQVFEDGACVKNFCSRCGNPYYVNFEGKTTGRQILECYEGGLNLCDVCYKREGIYRGYFRDNEA